MTDGESQLAIVTGAGTGIGRAIALRLACSGYVCIVTGRRKELLDETARLIAQQGGRAISVSADVTTQEGRAEILETADAQGERLRALINNAGETYLAPLFAQELQKWRDNFALNAEAAAFLSFEVMRRMANCGGGIVNIASMYGIIALNNAYYGRLIPAETPEGPVRGVAYAASKGALRLLSRELAVAGASSHQRQASLLGPRSSSTAVGHCGEALKALVRLSRS